MNKLLGMSSPDTIFALSSGPPPAAIAVIRISGRNARFGLETLIRRLPAPRRASLAKLFDPATGAVLDEGLALWFPGPRSETGEDMVELHLHGGRAVIAATLAALGRIDGLRPAGPGEFTRRALENGRMDLTAVEGLADLIFAETEAQRRQALHQLQGALGERVEDWRKRLIDSMAMVEARIDFSDEADVPEDLLGPALATARALAEEIRGALADDRRGERLRDGLTIAIAGPPNAGKSSLLNRIARREAAIVSPYPGTTRDVIEVHLDLEGYPATLLDTAGIREPEHPVEQEGVRRALARAQAADLVLWVVDASLEDQAAQPPADRGGSTVWMVRNKLDLLAAGSKPGAALESSGRRAFAISAQTGAGLDTLVAALAEHASQVFVLGEPSIVTRARHRAALTETVEALDRALEQGSRGKEDLVAEELRLAARRLGRITGRVDVEDILDVIFRDFCIGK
jgi:tRNA modification GTPase